MLPYSYAYSYALGLLLVFSPDFSTQEEMGSYTQMGIRTRLSQDEYRVNAENSK